MWSGLENRLVAYAADATLFVSIPSLMGHFLVEPLNRYLAKISVWIKLWDMKMNSI